MEIKTLPFQVNQEIVELALADNHLQRRHNEERKASNKKLWDKVHESYPELDGNGDFTLKCEFAEQGIIMLDTHDSCSDPRHKIARALSGLLKDVN